MFDADVMKGNAIALAISQGTIFLVMYSIVHVKQGLFKNSSF